MDLLVSIDLVSIDPNFSSSTEICSLLGCIQRRADVWLYAIHVMSMASSCPTSEQSGSPQVALVFLVDFMYSARVQLID